MEQPQTVAAIAAAIAEAVERPTPGQRRLLERLTHHSDRLATRAFQLAVLGQFKRGKSTLLNALIGFPLLSAGVLPLTAVPTFLTGGSVLRIRLTHLTGEVDDQTVTRLADLAAAVAAVTTEEHNPRNVRGLERVEVTVPTTGWLNDVTLIDTPGIGSTHAHNTDAAHAVLPECDAALFVLSVDPPITEIEAEYLSAICRTVSHVIVVVNKIDLIDAPDRQKAIGFLSAFLSKRNEQKIDQTIFPISARIALAARQEGDDQRFQQSGVAALEQHIRSALVDRKRVHLEASIGRKIADILEHLEGDTAITLRALGLPEVELDEKIGIFDDAVIEFTKEKESLHDLLSGEWKRALSKLDALCAEGEKRAGQALKESLTGLAHGTDLATERAAIASTIFNAFDREFGAIGDTVDADLRLAVDIHQQRYHSLAQRVRETAAALMDVTAGGSDSDDWFQLTREPYWVDQARIESLGSLTADGLARLLPKRIRHARQRRKLREAANNAITRNIAGLHWAMRQNIDDSFRRLLSSSTEAVDASIEATREVLALARTRRHAQHAALREDIERANASLARMAALRGQLTSYLQEAGDG